MINDFLIAVASVLSVALLVLVLRAITVSRILKWSSLYGALYAVLAVGTVQGDVGPFSLLKNIEIRVVTIAALFAVTLFFRFATPQGLRPARTISLIRTLLYIFAILSFSVLVSYQLATSQMFVLALYLAPIVSLAVAPPSFVYSALHAVGIGCTVQVIASITQGPYVQTLSGVEQLSGGLQPNVVALAASISIVFGLWLFATARYRGFAGLIVVLISCIAIYLSVSRTGVIVATAGVLTLLYLDGGRRARRTVLFLGSVISLWFLTSSAARSMAVDWFVRGDSDSISSLTGRTDIWELAIKYWNEKPVFGWGFGGLYSPGSSAGTFLSRVRGVNAHNSGLQLLVETGIVGLSIIVAILFLSVVVLVKACGVYRPLFLALMVVVLVNAIGSAGFATIGLAWSLMSVLVVAAGNLEVGGRMHQEFVRDSDVSRKYAVPKLGGKRGSG